MKSVQTLVLALGFALAPAAANPAFAINFEFTPAALNAIADNEMRRTQMCVVNDIRQPRLVARRQALLDDQSEARSMGRNDLARALEADLAKVETDLAEAARNFFRCDSALLLGPQVESLCSQLGPNEGALCPAIAKAKGESQALLQIADSMERLVMGQGEQGWRIIENPVGLGPDGRLIGAAVRRGNLQVSFSVGAQRFALGAGADAVPRDIEKRLKDVNRSHGIGLREDAAVYVPFLSAEVFGANGFAGETFQTLVGIKGAEGYVPLGPAVPVSIEAKATSHGVPLDARAWAELSSFDVIGIVGSKRVADKDEFLYFIGIETLGIQPLMDTLMAEFRGR